MHGEAEREYVEYVSARLPALRRAAHLLCRDEHRRTGEPARRGRVAAHSRRTQLDARRGWIDPRALTLADGSGRQRPARRQLGRGACIYERE